MFPNAGDACKLKVRRRFKPLGSLSDALKHYQLPPPGFQNVCTQTEQKSCDTECDTDPMTADFLLASFTEQFEQLTGQNQTDVLELLFSIACKTHGITAVPQHYIYNSLCAMQYLQSSNKSNILESTARVFGNMREDKSDTIFPMKRMPFGLLEYCINFYSSKSCSEVCAYIGTVSNGVY